ncbi:MAG: hypothetical protein NDJ89_06595 [Oligoflexia bacterium]|nr:hypothetical protein [Oligoflexia bacterium]
MRKPMQALLIAFFTLALPFASCLAADCPTANWPYARQQSKEDFHRLFEELPRAQLVAFFFQELSSPKEPSVAPPLATYLTNTEPDIDLRAFFELLATSADLGSTPKHRPLKLPGDLRDLSQGARIAGAGV